MLISDVLQKLTLHLAALAAEPFLQGIPDEAWHEVTQPFGAAEEAHGISHLAFAVLALRSPSTSGDRDATGWEVQARTEIEVQFAYRLRPDTQLADYRQAFAAARAVVRAVLDDQAWSGGEATALLLDGAQPLVAGDGDFVLIRTTYQVVHSYEV